MNTSDDHGFRTLKLLKISLLWKKSKSSRSKETQLSHGVIQISSSFISQALCSRKKKLARLLSMFDCFPGTLILVRILIRFYLL